MGITPRFRISLAFVPVIAGLGLGAASPGILLGAETATRSHLQVAAGVKVWLTVHNASDRPARYRLQWLQPEAGEQMLEVAARRYAFAPTPASDPTAESTTYEFELVVEEGAPPDLSWTLFSAERGLVERPITTTFPPTIRRQSHREVPADKATWTRFQGTGLGPECSAEADDEVLDTRWLPPDTLAVRIPAGPPGTISVKIRCRKAVLEPPEPLKRVPRPLELTAAEWSITPDGRLRWIVTGQGFSPEDTLEIDGLTVSTRFVSPSRLETTAEEFQNGPVRIRVVGRHGRVSPVRTVDLDWRPRLKRLTPRVLDPQRGGRVSLSGRDFIPGLSLKLGDTVLPARFVSSSLLVLEVPPMPAGDYPAVIVLPDGSTVTSSEILKVNAAPVIETIEYLPNPVVRMSSVQFAVRAFDPEGDPLDYTWSVLSGPVSNLRPHGDGAVADVGNRLEPIVIRITVRDSAGNETTRVIRVEVL